MDIKLETKMVVETTAYFHEGKLKNYPCDIYAWWGNDTCKEVDFNSEIENISLPEGKYKITITLERVSE